MNRIASLSRRGFLQGGSGLALAAGLGVPFHAAIAQDAKPVRGGTIIASMDLQPKSLDPIMGDAPTSDRYALTQIYEGLVRFDVNGELQPSLATSWEFAPDAQSIVFTLREGVVFHDGTPFDAGVVVANISRVVDPASTAPRSQDLADISGAEALDPMTVRIDLKQPSGAALASLAVEAGMMCSPAAMESSGQDYGRNPVGTGPYRFVEWVGGSHIKLTRNEKYWRAGADGQQLPYADGVTLRIIPTTAVKMVELMAGGIHIADGVTPRDFAEVEGNPQLRLVAVPPGIAQWMTFNVQKPPFDNIKLRQAVNAAIDRNFLMKAVTRGYGAVTPTWVPPTDWAFDASIPSPGFDPALVAKLLAEAGHPNGFSAKLSIIQRDPDTQIAQMIQAQLVQSKINLEIEILERQAWVPKVLGHQHEAAMGRVNVPRADPDHVFGPFFGRGAAQNWSGIDDEALFDVIADARRETDRTRRKELYRVAQEQLIENAYYAWLFFRESRHVARVELQNIVVDSGGAWQLGEAWLAPQA
ncbi:ABC transporter substrate-binding protein [Acuticoccus kandeliae]|uniref:ABC transporter substrate-binding protein n=1 Tax=Acuticoccus kandeliae TaxID=2073160 RepID=UPI000D3E5536|nr:ABC transporter substrate-binding protein [Acuticoccus kandeliae]